MDSPAYPYTGPERRAFAARYGGIERRAGGVPRARGMDSRARLFGHSIHQQLIVFPLGLLATAVLFDIGHLAFDSPTASLVSFWLIAAGIIGGLAAAPFGFVDWLAVPKGTRAKSIGAVHGAGNLLIVLLFIVSWWLRREVPQQPSAWALVLSFVGGGLALFTGWLGGELVARLGIGVSPDAGPNASNSMTAPHGRRD